MRRANQHAHPDLESRNDRRRGLFRTVTLACAIVVAWLAFRPAVETDAGLPWDKANHALAFAVLMVLAGRGWPDIPRSLLILVMLAAGVGIELVQGLPRIGRDADVADVAADGVGIAVGLVVLAIHRRRAGVRE
ncbi:hypothetical protein N0B44_31205 [Roseibacterium beibuensis]|uniref:hypothetical protein n=1 Tax=[Roseibacterium] beibuensis TaxID=1193142 RepID=UPI00217E8EA1|nr:hypothetical protein [Roseibacterium beibuensis]MCS6627385.1 hypothetical protein [Roseibacterium beibuensis]